MSASEIEVMERALKRERIRREKSELLLEDKSRKLFHSYQTLQESHGQLADALEEVKSQQKQLVQSEKLASLGTMSAGVAHEINNPLAFVFSNINSLSHAVEQFQEYHQHVGKVVAADSAEERQILVDQLKKHIVDADIEYLFGDCTDLITETLDGIQRVKSIVAGLKAFARSDAGEMETLSISECLQNTLKLVHNQIKFSMEVIVNLDELPDIKGYPGKLSQVFLNLVVNANQAMNDNKGTMTITGTITGTGVEESIVITFQDDGSGMSQGTMDNIFNPFFTTKPVGQGTGLGLSISHGIIEEHNGKIEVSSEPGTGTCFTITLPAIQQIQQAA